MTKINWTKEYRKARRELRRAKAPGDFDKAHDRFNEVRGHLTAKQIAELEKDLQGDDKD